jgi:hypothetical protein
MLPDTLDHLIVTFFCRDDHRDVARCFSHQADSKSGFAAAGTSQEHCQRHTRCPRFGLICLFSWLLVPA